MNPLQQLLAFLEHLNLRGIGYFLQSDAESLIVVARTEEGMHEILFFADGTIAIQSFEPGEDDAESVKLSDLLESFTAGDEQTH
jgi:hypothetical protein